MQMGTIFKIQSPVYNYAILTETSFGMYLSIFQYLFLQNMNYQ